MHALSQHDPRGVRFSVVFTIRCGQQFLLFFLGSWPGRTVFGGNVNLWSLRGSGHTSIGSGVGGLGGVGAQCVYDISADKVDSHCLELNCVCLINGVFLTPHDGELCCHGCCVLFVHIYSPS